MLKKLEKNKNFIKNHKPELFNDYEANDIAIFKNPKKWHTWQKQLYSLIFGKGNKFKISDQRKIIRIVDRKGNSSKPSLFKWFFYNKPTIIDRLDYESVFQLGSSGVNLGKKFIYY